jgi:hypothetical protein
MSPVRPVQLEAIRDGRVWSQRRGSGDVVCLLAA